MKAKIKGSSEDKKFKLTVPLDEFLEWALGKERQTYADCDIDVYLDRHRDEDEEDSAIVLSFYTVREFKPGEDGLLREVPREPLRLCANKQDIERLEAKIEALEANSHTGQS